MADSTRAYFADHFSEYYSRYYAFYYGSIIADQFATDVLRQQRLMPLAAFEREEVRAATAEERATTSKGPRALPNRFSDPTAGNEPPWRTGLEGRTPVVLSTADLAKAALPDIDSQRQSPQGGR